MESPYFENRYHAGRQLAQALQPYSNREDVIVLGLPRGGVPVAYEVAQALHVPLDVFIVRKVGVPGQEELALGAIASGGVKVVNRAFVRELEISPHELTALIQREQHELERRERLYRGDQPPIDVRGRTVILVDDGLATGATMRAAVLALRQQQPARIVMAVPVASVEACGEFDDLVDHVVCLFTPVPFQAVGLWYEDFSQTSDDEVRFLLQQVRAIQGELPHAQ
jgi:putative phosphoribosyl transferase